MKIKADILEVSTYSYGYFIITYGNGIKRKCHLTNSEQWDTLYDYLTKPITLQIDKTIDDVLYVTIV